METSPEKEQQEQPAHGENDAPTTRAAWPVDGDGMGALIRDKGEGHFREMLDALPEAIYITDVEGRLTHFNPAAAQFSGRTPELGTDRWCVSWKLYWPDGTPMPHGECPMAVAMEEGRSIRGAEGIAERPDGTHVWFEAYPSPLRDDEGEIVGGINMLVDVTERKRTERLQEQQTRLLELIVTGAPLGECLSSLCNTVSRLEPGVRASVLLAGEQRQSFQRSIAPDFLPSFGERLEGAPINDLAIGTCGEAVFRDQPITCEDIASDEKWSKSWRDLCVAHDVLACRSTPIRDKDGVPCGSFMLCFDEPRAPNAWERRLADFGTHIASIAFERDRAHQALRRSEEQYRMLVESAEEYAIMMIDPEGRISSWNTGAKGTLGYEKDEIVGQSAAVLYASEDRAAGLFEEKLEEARTNGWAAHDHWLARKDDSHFWGTGVMTALRNPEGDLRGFVKVMRDNTDRKEAADKLQEMNETLEEHVEERTGQVRRLTSALTLAEQNERRRIARILHDDIQQLLYGAEMSVRQLRRREDASQEGTAAAGAEERRKMIDQIEEVLDETIEATRTLSAELSPPVLQDEDLEGTLRWLTSHMEERYGLAVKLHLEAAPRLQSRDRHTLLFRAARELLFNVVKHASIDQAHLTTRAEGGWLFIEVHDRGEGFDPAVLEEKQHGQGLAAMRERLKLVGGRLEVEATPGEGTRVHIALPDGFGEQA